MSEVKFYQAGQDLENPNTDCKSLTSGTTFDAQSPCRTGRR